MKREVVFSDNGTLTNYTDDLFNPYGDTVTLTPVASEDYLYVGSSLPFNHFYLDITAENTTSSNLSVSHWDGNEWKECVSVEDGTSLSGNTFGQAGYVEFVPSKNNVWGRDDTVKSDDTTEEITG